MELSIQERNTIVEMAFREKKRHATIARKMGCHRTTVEHVIRQFSQQHSIETRHRSGRPSTMDPHMTSTLDKIIKRKPTATSADLCADLVRKSGRRVSERTVRRARRSLGYRPVHASVRPGLNSLQAAQRLRFCQKHRAAGLKHAVFMDEMAVELDSQNRIYWIKPGEKRPIEYSFPQRVRLNVWAAIWYEGRTTFHFTKKIFNSDHYLQVLRGHLLPCLPLRRKVFIHDGVPWHWTHAVQEWCAANWTFPHDRQTLTQSSMYGGG
jgi:transposase